MTWVLCLCVFAALTPTLAAAAPFKLTTGTLKVTKQSWGPHCGDAPKSSDVQGGAVYTLGSKQFLTPTGGAPQLFGPQICHQATGLPSLKFVRTGNRIECRSPANASTQAMGTIKLVRDGDTMSVQHTFSYDWRLHGSHCQLRTEGVWRLEAIKRNTTRPGAASTKCHPPGRPARIEALTPRETTVAPKGRVRLRASVVDQDGCPLKRRIRWSTKDGRINRQGFFRPTKTQLGGVATVTARAGRLRLRFRVKVTNEANLVRWLPKRPAIEAQTKVSLPTNAGLMGVKVSPKKSTKKQSVPSARQWIRVPLSLAFLGLVCLSIGLIMLRREPT
ncbi:MAG: hypothetical protein VX589_00620 [Myxococcota bacterium]|nr:hypothetical protein [Myxococcota bacterium]